MRAPRPCHCVSQESFEAKSECSGHLAQPHCAERLLRCWGSGARSLALFSESRGVNVSSNRGTCSGSSAVSLSLGVKGQYPKERRALNCGKGSDCAGKSLALRGLPSSLSDLRDPHCGALFWAVALIGLNRLELNRLELNRLEPRVAPIVSIVLVINTARHAEAKLSFLDARGRIVLMLKEYVSSGDMPEVERQLRALNAPFGHHEVVKQAILLATDDMPHCKVRSNSCHACRCLSRCVPRSERPRFNR